MSTLTPLDPYQQVFALSMLSNRAAFYTGAASALQQQLRYELSSYLSGTNLKPVSQGGFVPDTDPLPGLLPGIQSYLGNWTTWDPELWAELPDELPLRVVTFRVAVKGFRTKEVTVVTTLLDETQYPDAAIAELYRRRWAVERFFREIKTVLGLDVLRCQSPELIEKEVWMQVIAYNVIRALMFEAAQAHRVPLDRLSFKGTVDTLRQWTPLLAPALFVSRLARRELLRVIAADLVPLRPHRTEPRAVKRRPKVYQLLTKPRRQMRVSPSRNLK